MKRTIKKECVIEKPVTFPWPCPFAQFLPDTIRPFEVSTGYPSLLVLNMDKPPS